MRYKDIKGQRFGQLKVIEKDTRKNAKGQAYWICRCQCERLLSVRGDGLRLGTSTRCSECGSKARPSRYIEEGDTHEDKN